MKRIVICYDGTWNTLADPSAVTNVVRVGQAVKATDEHTKVKLSITTPASAAAGPSTVFSAAYLASACEAT